MLSEAMTADGFGKTGTNLEVQMGRIWGIGVGTETKNAILGEYGGYNVDAMVRLDFLTRNCNLEDALTVAYELFDHSSVVRPFMVLLFTDLEKHINGTAAKEVIDLFWWNNGVVPGGVESFDVRIPEGDGADVYAAMAAMWIEIADGRIGCFWQFVEFIKMAIEEDDATSCVGANNYIRLVLNLVASGAVTDVDFVI